MAVRCASLTPMHQAECWPPTPIGTMLPTRSGYIAAHINANNPHRPLGDLAPWDPGYQALFYRKSGRHYFLDNEPYPTRLGRGGSFAKDSYLLVDLAYYF